MPVNITVSERNGVGAWPTSDLARRVAYGHFVVPAWTDARRKMSGYGMTRGLLQQRRLLLPAHPQLLSQLRALQFEQTASGLMKIEGPESAGHDDIADSLMRAMSAIRADEHRDLRYRGLASDEARTEYRRASGLGNAR